MATPRGRIIRVHDLTWDAAKARAAREGRPLSGVLNDFLEEYSGVATERRAESRREPVA